MEKLPELKAILKEITGILEMQALVASRKSDAPMIGESGKQLTPDEKDKAVSEEYSAIRKRIDALR